LLPKSNIKVKAICDYCECEYTLTYNNYHRSTKNFPKLACLNCRQKKAFDVNKDERSIKLFNKLKAICSENNYTLITTQTDCTRFDIEVQFICSKHGLRKMKAYIFLKLKRCNACGLESIGSKLKKTPTEVKDIVESKNNNILLNAEEYVDINTKNLRVICGLCKKEHITTLASISNSNGACNECGCRIGSDLTRHSPEYIKSIIDAENGNTLLNSKDYKNASLTNLKIKCGECGKIFNTSFETYFRGTKRCRSCSSKMSHNERLIRDILIIQNVTFIQEQRFPDCRDINSLPFDFYLEAFNLIIEYDGEGHYQNGFGNLESTQKHDKIKNEYCKKNGINLLRIPYWEKDNLEEIILNELEKYGYKKCV